MAWDYEGETIHNLLHHNAHRFPEKIFVRYHDQAWTFAQWDALTEQLAEGFAALGVKRGDRVLLALPNGPEVYADITALGKIGAIPMPINTAMKPDEVLFMLNDAACELAVVDGSIYAQVNTYREEAPMLKRLVVHGGNVQGEDLPYEALLENGKPFARETDPHQPFVLLYTSGTTGFPKGALVMHSAVLFSLQALKHVLQLTEQDVCVNVLPSYHLFSIAAEYALMGVIGGTFIVEDGFQPHTALQDMQRYRATWECGVPSMFIVLCELAEKSGADIRSFRYGITSGAPVPTPVLKRWEALTGGTLCQVYGSTEIALGTVERPDHTRKIGSAGQPSPGFEFVILDEDDRPLPPGQVGEICVRHAGGISHYWNRPQEDAQAHRDGWFHTGDLGYFDEENYLYVVDRKKDMIIYGGENIYPAEVEKVLLEHPAVAEVAVLGRPDPVKGEEPVALIRLNEGMQVTHRELRNFARQHLSDFKLPRSFIYVDDFPRTGTGKIRKFVLREQLGQSTASATK
ncbi:MAG: AMP-binding protein [Firmicutes bacterium]|nr:AMP-binding protein [Bacillota bacterium]